jgi:hypothetical protein
MKALHTHITLSAGASYTHRATPNQPTKCKAGRVQKKAVNNEIESEVVYKQSKERKGTRHCRARAPRNHARQGRQVQQAQDQAQ